MTEVLVERDWADHYGRHVYCVFMRLQDRRG